MQACTTQNTKAWVGSFGWGTLHWPIMHCIEMVGASCNGNFLQVLTIISCNSMGLPSKSVNWSCFWDNQLWFAIPRTSPQTQWGTLNVTILPRPIKDFSTGLIMPSENGLFHNSWRFLASSYFILHTLEAAAAPMAGWWKMVKSP